MKRSIEEDSRTRFSVRCEAASRAYLSLAMLVVSMAMLVGIWWPGEPVELVAPWVGGEWGHSKAWMYVLFLGLVGSSAALLGMYFGQWRRGYRICFDAEESMVRTEEWWEGEEVEASFPLGRFCEVEIYEEDDGQWILGVVLENGSCWHLLDGKRRQDLEDVKQRLQSLIEGGQSEEEVLPPMPEVIDIEGGDLHLVAGWPNRGHQASKLGFSVAVGLLAIASVVPLLSTFDGDIPWLVGTMVMGAVALVLPSLLNVQLRGLSVALGAWLGVVVAGVCGLGANWAYFPLATLGLWALGSMTVRSVMDMKTPNPLSLEIDQWGAFYKNGSPVAGHNGIARIADLEGALTNVHRLEPSTMWLVTPGGKEANRERCLHGIDGEDDHWEEVAIRLRMAGLSLFERIALSFAVDDEIRRRKDSDVKIKIRPQL